MAKAKKTTTSNGTAPTTKGADKPKPPAAVPVVPPLVDTTMAAQSAAKQLVAHLVPSTGVAATGKESASFKAMKQNLAHPAVSGLDSVLDKTAHPSSRKPNTPFAGPKSVGGGGRNQTFGADVNRTGVPRRTSGG